MAPPGSRLGKSLQGLRSATVSLPNGSQSSSGQPKHWEASPWSTTAPVPPCSLFDSALAKVCTGGGRYCWFSLGLKTRSSALKNHSLWKPCLSPGGSRKKCYLQLSPQPLLLWPGWYTLTHLVSYTLQILILINALYLVIMGSKLCTFYWSNI